MIGLAAVAQRLVDEHGWDRNQPVERHLAALRMLAGEIGGVAIISTEWGEQIAELDGRRLVAAVAAKQDVERRAMASQPPAPLPADGLSPQQMHELGLDRHGAAALRSGVMTREQDLAERAAAYERDMVSTMTGVAYRLPADPLPPVALPRRLTMADLFPHDHEVIDCGL